MQLETLRLTLDTPRVRELRGNDQVRVKYYDSELGWTTKTLNTARLGESGELILVADTE